MLGLLVLLGLLTTSLTGCLRIHAALAVSQDDVVSGDVVVSALPRDREDKGPTLTIPPELADKVTMEPYSADGYVGQKLTLNNVGFTEFAVLVESISTAEQYRIAFHRSGSLVSLAGSIDLTRVPADRADVQLKVAFPGTVTRTTGDNTDGTVTWEPKPGAVTEFNATTQYANSSGVSWIQWVAMVGGGAVLVALLVVVLALSAHRRTLRAERLAAARR
ncbi:DUF3153 domain-containing protein [Actinophytocola gossypii]|uniref:DUF3153 domain-containing protein n=1 Tax=Actinophytocola gossypii TaxID=2812003 RepID=A0ABT2J8G9_9PSEU|nr:DUF3153 domain-containing protein [Actinophytocola gossypii]MCT2584071.1 DUF3153 domain-containing protein [Actinophytocola gossypii]